MRICFFGIYNKDYARNNILINGLRENGVEIIECNEDALNPKRYKLLISKLLKLKNNYDYVFSAYPSPVPAILAKIFSRKKIVVDAFYSMYDAVVNDRKEYYRFHPKALRLLIMDWLSVIVADIILVDTEMHKNYWASWFLVNGKKIFIVPNGVDVKRIYPTNNVSENIKNITVTFYGNYIPLQGVDKIVKAFTLLKNNQDISFRMIGNGQEFEKIQKLVMELDMKNKIEIVNRVSYEKLNEYLSVTEIVLGIFGDSDKAKRVVPNKVYEGCAARKAVITMDSPAIREMYSEDEIFMVKSDPQSIASAIRFLRNNPDKREGFANKCYKKTIEKYSPKAIGFGLMKLLERNK